MTWSEAKVRRTLAKSVGEARQSQTAWPIINGLVRQTESPTWRRKCLHFYYLGVSIWDAVKVSFSKEPLVKNLYCPDAVQIASIVCFHSRNAFNESTGSPGQFLSLASEWYTTQTYRGISETYRSTHRTTHDVPPDHTNTHNQLIKCDDKEQATWVTYSS